MTNKLFSLIDSIIEDLVNQDSNLENALLKTQVLAFKLKNDKLKSWVNCELNGYIDLNEVPEFRIITTQLKGNLFQSLGYGGYQQLQDTVLPIEYLKFEGGGNLSEQKFGERISELQQMSKSTDGLIGEMPYSFLVMMSKKMSPWEVIKAWKVIPSSALVGILSTIKSNLINFLLELKEELGDENIPLMEKKKEIDKIIDKNIGSINAKNLNISFGDGNLQNANSGNGSNIQLSIGELSNQKIEDTGVNELLNFIKQNIGDSELKESEKEDIIQEVIRAERQLGKPNPSITIINQSLKVVYDVLTGVAGNAYTERVLNWITQIGINIG